MLLLISMIKGMLRMLFMSWMEKMAGELSFLTTPEVAVGVAVAVAVEGVVVVLVVLT